MSPDEILADLRDIHLPAAETDAIAASGFNFWPLLVVAALLSLIALLRYRQRGSERRALQRAVKAFATAPSQGGMTELLSLRHRAAENGVTPPPLPAACFSPEGANDNAVLAGAAQELGEAIAR